MVKHSYSRVLFVGVIVICIVLVFVGFQTIVEAIVEYGPCADSLCQKLRGDEIWQGVWECLSAVVLIAQYVGLWRKTADLDQRRRAATQGSGTALPLSDVISTTEQVSLSLPTTVKVRIAWKSWWVRGIFICLGVFLQIIAIWGTLAPTPGRDRLPLPLEFLLFEAIVALMYGLVYLVIFFASHGEFTVTNEGLRARRFGSSQFVRWHEARFFARLSDTQWELSSATRIVRFRFLSHRHFQEPTIPFDLYRAQMAAVLKLIAERTGLPLMDLPEPPRR